MNPEIQCEKCSYIGCTVQETTEKPKPISMADYALKNKDQTYTYQWAMTIVDRHYEIRCPSCNHTHKFTEYAPRPPSVYLMPENPSQHQHPRLEIVRGEMK